MDRFLFTAVALALALSSCDDAGLTSGGGAAGRVAVELSGYAGAGEPAQPEAAADGMEGYHFVDGELRYVYDRFSKTASGHSLGVSSLEGTLYVVAWTGGTPPHERPAPGTAESDWLESRAASAGVFFTGSARLSGPPQQPVRLALRRGVARYDLVADAGDGVSVSRAVIRNAELSGRLFPGEGLSAGAGGRRGDVELAPSAYLHEQYNTALSVEVSAVVDGREQLLESPLPPAVERNTRYTVTLRRDTAGQEVYLAVVPWGDGGTADAFPDRGGALSVDAAAGGLPPGAQLSADGRTLTLPHRAADFTMRIRADEELELVSAGGYLLDVAPVEPAAAGGMNVFRVSKRLYAPGVAGRDVVVQFRRKGLSGIYPDDNVVLRLLPNPTAVSGPMDFDNDGYRHDFGRYVDNGLGVFTLPEGSRLSVEFAPGEDPWVRLDRTGDNSWRVVGGWRPNDPTADGRRQEAVIVVSDGQAREEYTVSRRNYGLPVTWLHGIWWCKYNAMGSSRSFDDQILSSADPAAAAGKSVYDYLAECTPEEYRRLWQWAYQGSGGQGMKVAEQDGRLVMDGFSADVADHINRLPADALSPDGYELPSMADFNRIFDATDYVWLMWNGTHTLKTPWNGHSQIRREQRRKNGVTVGGTAADDLIYIAMWSPDYPGHEPVVWYGPGAQWNADGITHAGHRNNILFGVHSPAGEGWYMAGAMNAFYLHRNGAGSRDTRILRFRKSDVDYIY